MNGLPRVAAGAHLLICSQLQRQNGYSSHALHTFNHGEADKVRPDIRINFQVSQFSTPFSLNLVLIRSTFQLSRVSFRH